ncbi:MAG TPA: patatin-like phospholipase family protein [Caulobacteraceae bacterium]|nr:patatin-like phospholipase family protein [Caulobacteraceae bacterium]
MSTTTAARKPRWKTHKAPSRPPFESIALLLQGGGALGAYQAGVYQGLSEARLEPDWVAGISIGAVNSALIAGNPPQARLEKLRAFWELVTAPPTWRPGQWITGALWPFDLGPFAPRTDAARGVMNQISAGRAVAHGVNGFFAPRAPAPWLQAAGALEATSYYDGAPLKATLERLVDFDRINDETTRFSVGAVNVATGNFVYFDNATHAIGPEHVMASCALPPGLAAVEIEGEHYWDGGLVSNTPLQWVLESEPRHDTLAFQVDLWSARGALPSNMAEVMTRQKEIQFSSRTRANSDRFKYGQKIRNALADLMARLPDELKDSPEAAVLRPVADRKVYNLVQLIYRSRQYEGDSKDYEFSRRSMEDHWRAGYHDTERTLRHPEVLERPPPSLEGVRTFDLAQDGRE